ncbi:glycosyltransferase family 4 protein [Novosphingobium tardum]|uniref:Glycosyltransferase family 4 protein n=1 Tax=Novosphingobium tardum TaxID=1538021 RepID=A0ABV8RKR1_9SPHN
MHLLLVTHYFPPESNAPANRAIEHARAWISQGHRVTIVTAAPSHPGGRVYPGYVNRFARETVDGIEVIRLKTFIAANRGIVGRSLAFVSFFAAVAHARRRLPASDVVISTSPQFFSGLAGWLLKSPRRPWVLEIRDLWPESIVAVGAMRRNPVIRGLELLERAAYRAADLLVVTTDAHRAHVLAQAPGKRAIVVRNGVTAQSLVAAPGAGAAFRAQYGLDGKFVLTYLGTHGMAHRLETVVEAAALCRDDPRIHFLLVGDGADRGRVAAIAARNDLPNLTMLGQQRREAVPAIWAASDAALVLLKDSETFLSVLPSKMIEAMAMARPVVLGVAGEARSLLEEADAGIAIRPEDAGELAEAARTLASDPERVVRLGDNGRTFVVQRLDRTRLAGEMVAAIAALRP